MSMTGEETVDALNGGADEQQQTEAPETVRLAKDMGWKDPADWQGEPPKNGFVSASEYIRRSEKILPIVNARARNAEERAQKLTPPADQQPAQTQILLAARRSREAAETISTAVSDGNVSMLERANSLLSDAAFQTSAAVALLPR